MTTTAVSKKRVDEVAVRISRVPLARVDRDEIARLAGFELDATSKIETRHSDNLVQAVMYVFNGIIMRAAKKAVPGQSITLPGADEVLSDILGNQRVRQRMRDVVAQANICNMQSVPVKIARTDEKMSAARDLITYVLENLEKAFEGMDESARPKNIPVLQPLFIGADSPAKEGPAAPGQGASAMIEKSA